MATPPVFSGGRGGGGRVSKRAKQTQAESLNRNSAGVLVQDRLLLQKAGRRGALLNRVVLRLRAVAVAISLDV